MSVASIRAGVVDALNTVPGVEATGYTPGVVAPGMAWVVLSTAVPLNWCIDQGTWFVFVAVTPATNAAAVAYGDGLIDAILPALKPVAKVTAVEPWAWPLEQGGGAAPVIRLTVEA